MFPVEIDRTPGQDADAGAGVGAEPWDGEDSLCALCAGPGDGDVAEHRLAHGVVVLLCRRHRSDAFLTQCGGDDLVRGLRTMWRAAGCLTRRRELALAAHTRRLAALSPPARPRPGSYAWPAVRHEAEQRWAAGLPPARVMRELRELHGGSTAVVPSLRTMRRWFAEGRWLRVPPRKDAPGLGERTLAWIAETNRGSRQLVGSDVFPGWPDRDRQGRPYRRR